MNEQEIVRDPRPKDSEGAHRPAISVFTEIRHLSLDLPFRVKERRRNVKFLIVSQVTQSDNAFTSFCLDAVWHICCTSDIGRLC